MPHDVVHHVFLILNVPCHCVEDVVQPCGLASWYFYLTRCRRLAKDWECPNHKARAFLLMASIRLMIGKLCQTSQCFRANSRWIQSSLHFPLSRNSVGHTYMN